MGRVKRLGTMGAVIPEPAEVAAAAPQEEHDTSLGPAEGNVAVVAPVWAEDLCHRLHATRIDSFSEALRAGPFDRLVVVDQARRGPEVTNRSDALRDLAAMHGHVLVVSYNARLVTYLRPDESDGPVPTNVAFTGPEIEFATLTAWTQGLVTDVLTVVKDPDDPGSAEVELRTVAASSSHPPAPALGVDYLRKQRPVRRETPWPGYKRVYLYMDPQDEVHVAGAFAGNPVPLNADWVCGHQPQHASIGPDCFDGFAAYRYREDALVFRAPDAALAHVAFSGAVMAADSAVLHCGMRGEHQRVHALELPSSCQLSRTCDQAATVVAIVAAVAAPGVEEDLVGFRELRSACGRCASDRSWLTVSQLAEQAQFSISWLAE